MDNVDNQDRQPDSNQSLWKTFAVYSAASLQLGTCLVVFGFFGHLAAQKWNMAWLTPAGIVLGLVVGVSGMAYLARQLLGDHHE